MNNFDDMRNEHLQEDGRKTIVRCSNCETELIEIWVTRPNAPLKSTINTNCGHCGDKAFEVKIPGMFLLGECESELTRIKDIETVMSDDMSEQFLTVYTSKRND